MRAAAALFALAAAPAAAEDPPVLTVYTYDSFVTEWGPGPKVEAAFEAQCRCDLQLVAAGDGAALLSRLRLEGARTDADLVLGLDQNLVAAARETGLFAPHGQAVATDVPGGWSDPDFLPYDWGWFAFVYDETRLTDAPASFADLRDAPPEVTIIIQDPRTSTPGLGLAQWVDALYGDDAAEVWAALAPRVVTVTKGWWEAYGAFLEGEAMMALSYTTSPAYHDAVEGDRTKKAAIFAEGHPIQIELVAKLAGTDQPALADAFLAFVSTAAFQEVIPETNWMYPAVTPSAGLPDAFQRLAEPAATVATDAARRDAAIAAWRDGLSR